MAARKASALDAPLSAAVRSALGLLGTGPVDTTLAAFESIGASFAGSSLNRRRRDATMRRIAFAFPDWDGPRVQSCAEGVWRHLFRLAGEVLVSGRLIRDGSWLNHVRFEPVFRGLDDVLDGRPAVCVTAHLGNFEIIGPVLSLLGVPMQAVYRPLDFKPLDDIVQGARRSTGMRLIDKFGAMRRLPSILDSGAVPAIVADQNAGERGEFVPFFGRLASSYKSVASVAMKRDAVLVVGAVVRDEPPRSLGVDALHDAAAGRRRDSLSYTCRIIEAIRPEDWRDQPDPAFYITARYRLLLERLVRQAPDQYFWMHRVWKSRPAFERERSAFPPELRDKLLALPWMTPAEVERIEAQSEADAAFMAETGSTRLT
ncbi:MAG: lysophospholipid acyltransferase family protein [Planctomycetota bacterium]